MKAYIVMSILDEDGGFGDAVETKEVDSVFLDKEKAEAYVADNSHKHVYDSPYQDLYTGELRLEEVDLIK